MVHSKSVFVTKLLKMSLTLLLGLGLFLLPDAKADAFSYYYSKFPQGTIGLARPTISFSIENPDEPLQPSSYFLYLNDKPVPASYDPASMKVTYTPEADLAPGTYRVRLVLNYSGYQSVQHTWSFTVADNAISQLPSVFSQEQQEGLKAINDYRAVYGLKPLQFNGALTAAAVKHAQYLFNNKIDAQQVSLHDESPSLPGFIGSSLGERAKYVGYTLGIGEDVSFHTGSLVQSIDELFDAPYHRIPFLNPDTKEVGIDKEGDYVVIEFGTDEQNAAQLTVSPAPGDPYVPTEFKGYEAPDPLRMHTGTDYPVGYPLMAAVNGAHVQKVKLVSARLTDAGGQEVKLLSNDPANDDHLTGEVILLPAKPLSPDTSYTANIKLSAVMQDGTSQTFEKQWSFRTEPSAGVGKQKLHADLAAYLQQMAPNGKVQRTVSFGLDDSSYTLDGVRYPLKLKPLIADGTSYLWVRDLAAALGALVDWDDARKAAIYTKNGRQITFFTNRPFFAINGAEQSTDAPAKLIDNYTMIPVRLLSEVLGAKVDYIDALRKVIITY